MFALKGGTSDRREVARELGVNALMSGTLRQVDGRIVIDIELTDVRDGSLILGRQYVQQPATGMLPMQSQIAQDVASQLRLKLTGEHQRKLAAIPTGNPEAYQRYLKGMYFERRATPVALHQAIDSFKEAVVLDSNYAQAYAGLAQAHLELGLFFEAPQSTMPKAREYANQALRLDADLPDARIALGLVSLMFDWDWDAAAKVLTADGAWSQGALEMFSCSAHLLEAVGRGPEAEQVLRNAMVADPLSPALKAELGCGSYYRRQYDQAVRENREALELDPNNFNAYWGLGRALGQQKKYSEALDALNKVKERTGETPALITAEIGYVLAASGRASEARAVLKTLAAQSSREFVDPYLVAAIHVALGDTRQTLVFLEEAFAAKSGFMVALNNEPKWDTIRSNPQFKDIAKRVGF